MNLADRTKGTLALVLGCVAITILTPSCGDDDTVMDGAGNGGGGRGGAAGSATGGKSGSTGKAGNGGGGKAGSGTAGEGDAGEPAVGGSPAGGSGGSGGNSVGGSGAGTGGKAGSGGTGGTAAGTGGTTGGTGGAGGKAGSGGVGGTSAGTGGTTGGTAGTAGKGGTGGTGGSAAGAGGTAAGTGGTAGTTGGGGTGGSAAGTGGTGGSSAGTGGVGGAVTCGTGCAAFDVQFNGTDQQVVYSINFPAPVNMAGSTVTAHVYFVRKGAGGAFGVWTKSPVAPNSDYTAVQLSTLPLETWTDVVYHPTAAPAAGAFDATGATQLQFALTWYGSAQAGPTTVWIDSITVALAGTGTVPGPYLFTTDLSAVDVNGAYVPNPVPNSLTWIP